MANSSTPTADHENPGRRPAHATRRRPSRRRHALHCARCATTWLGAEADRPSCGLPATAQHAHPGTALQLLLR